MPHTIQARVHPEMAAAAELFSLPYVNPCTIPRFLHSGLIPEFRDYSWAVVNCLDRVGAPQKETAEAGLHNKTALPVPSEAGKMQRDQ